MRAPEPKPHSAQKKRRYPIGFEEFGPILDGRLIPDKSKVKSIY